MLLQNLGVTISSCSDFFQIFLSGQVLDKKCQTRKKKEQPSNGIWMKHFVLQNPRSAIERNNLTKTGLFAVICSLKESCFNHNFWGLKKANNLYSCLSSWKYLYFILWLMLFDTNKTDWKKKFEISLCTKKQVHTT